MNLTTYTLKSPVPVMVVISLGLAAAALYLLLPKPRKRPVVVGAILGIAAVIVAGLFLVHSGLAPLPEKILFYIFSGMAVLGGGAMLTQRNPARAAISFALVVLNVCGLFLLEGAPFLMAATLIIYAGAIIVTFLFVLMLAQQRGFSDADDRSREPLLASFAGFVLLGTILLVIDHAHPDQARFDELLAKVDRAAEQPKLEDVNAVIGDRDAFLADLKDQRKRLAGYKDADKFDAAVTDLEEDMNSRRPDFKTVQWSLFHVSQVGHEIQKEYRPKAVPAANVAGIGRRLYSEHLLAVEIGGTLLLVATIGAIAITQRRQEAHA